MNILLDVTNNNLSVWKLKVWNISRCTFFHDIFNKNIVWKRRNFWKEKKLYSPNAEARAYISTKNGIRNYGSTLFFIQTVYSYLKLNYIEYY